MVSQQAQLYSQFTQRIQDSHGSLGPLRGVVDMSPRPSPRPARLLPTHIYRHLMLQYELHITYGYIVPKYLDL